VNKPSDASWLEELPSEERQLANAVLTWSSLHSDQPSEWATTCQPAAVPLLLKLESTLSCFKLAQPATKGAGTVSHNYATDPSTTPSRTPGCDLDASHPARFLVTEPPTPCRTRYLKPQSLRDCQCNSSLRPNCEFLLVRATSGLPVNHERGHSVRQQVLALSRSVLLA
jgi:hypothetical protein